MMPKPIEQWHHIVKSRDLETLKSLLAENVVFESPVVHTPQLGKAIATKYLQAALRVLGNKSFSLNPPGRSEGFIGY
ncbi:MAG: nuclear transport factor 2 family protein [Comamonadaceae bacterium]